MAVAEIMVMHLVLMDLLEDQEAVVVQILDLVHQVIHLQFHLLKDKMVEMEQHTTLVVAVEAVVAEPVESVLLLLLDLAVVEEMVVLGFKLISIQIIIIGLAVVAAQQFKMVQLALEMVVLVVEVEVQLLPLQVVQVK